MRKWDMTLKITLLLGLLFICINRAFSDERSIVLPKYLTPAGKDAGMDDKAGKKISGLLHLQIKIRKSYREQPTTQRLAAMRNIGMRTPEVETQLVYLHAKRKLSASKIKSLKKIGVTVYEDSWIPPVKSHPTGYVIASAPVDRLYTLAGKPFVVRLDTAERAVSPKNDEAAKSIKADSVWSDYSYDGSGVRIAVLDSGLDTTHKDIPTPTVSKDYSNFPSLDDTIENRVTEHGTHVAGSALGRGTQSSGKYKGMAYGADLIFLKIGDDSTASASTAAITSAIKAAVDSYDADIITMSYGGFNTYNDGSEEDCQAVDYAFSKGALVFVSAGNEADGGTHYSGTVTAHGATDYIKVNVGNTTQASLYLFLNWFDGAGVSNNLDLTLYDESKAAVSTNIFRYEYSESPKGTESELVYSNAYISGPATYYVKVENTTDSDQFFHIYSLDYYATFENADPAYTIGSPAAADNAIAVASYVTRPSWTDYKGNTWHYSVNKTAGTVSSFSSRGPRIDGAKKPDIAAPGQGIISARDKIVAWPGSEDDYVIDNDGTNDGNGPADYLLSQGTSMACPVAAGAAALLLQANSSLKGSPDSVRNALFQAASNKGEHNNTDGYGYLNVFNAVSYVASITPSPSPTPAPSSTPPPAPLPSPEFTPSIEKGTIFGYVEGARGNPLESVKIKLKGVRTEALFTEYSDADGYFEFGDLEADTYVIIAKKKGYKKARKTVAIEAGEEKEIQIKMKRAKNLFISKGE